MEVDDLQTLRGRAIFTWYGERGWSYGGRTSRGIS
jgi:hypothetical protein